MGNIHTREESSGEKNLRIVPHQVEASDSVIEKEEVIGRNMGKKEHDEKDRENDPIHTLKAR